mgnify:CR=1 FL=1
MGENPHVIFAHHPTKAHPKKIFQRIPQFHLNDYLMLMLFGKKKFFLNTHRAHHLA